MANEFRYLPDTEQDIKEMMETLEIHSIEELFQDIPENIRLQEEMALPEVLSESALTAHMRQMAARNVSTEEASIFLGAGTYDHYIPSVVDHVISRSEFYTAYTPYQPEVSQGELQAIFEFQTMITELTGMDAANSSLYDGFTSLGEAASLAVTSTKRSKVLISKGVHPQGREVLTAISKGREFEIVEISLAEDRTNLSNLKESIDEDTAAIVVQYPNFLGSVEDLRAIKEIATTQKALLIVMANPLALGLLEAPGKLGADIVVGDMQPLGLSMSAGGPHCGYFTVNKKHLRKIPGRIIGQTTDTEGKRGFVMTLQTREQHIRREKASSNMSSNQALNALASAVCMAALGKEGIQEMAQLNIDKADYLANQLKNKGFKIFNQGAFFNEFAVELDRPVPEVNTFLLDKGIIGGYDLEPDYGMKNAMLLCVTDQRTKEEIDTLVSALEELNHD